MLAVDFMAEAGSMGTASMAAEVSTAVAVSTVAAGFMVDVAK
jgi:hypothetical protein